MAKSTVEHRLLGFFCLIFLMILPNVSYTQITDIEASAQRELNKRGVDQVELQDRLSDKGINLDELNKLSPQEVAEVQTVIERTIAEMEAEKRKTFQADKTRPQKDQMVRLDTVPVDPSPIEVDEIRDSLNLSDEMDVDIYGQQIFRNRSIKVYNSTVGAKPPSTYILGPGDELIVSIWGLSRYEEKLVVNSQGYVSPRRMPRIFINGFSVEQVRKILEDRYSKYYRFRNNEFDVIINYSRVIQINIFGEVNNYGGFSLPATNTAFNALVAAGGPTDIGSVRRIKLRRGSRVRMIDVYAYMNDPTIANDYYLQNNDIIQVPVAEMLVTIVGEVNRPFKYEMLPEESLNDLIRYAGGLKSKALRSRLKITRFLGDRKTEIEVDLDAEGSTFRLQHGDEIVVQSVIPEQTNIVSVTGEVDYPGEYARSQGLKISQLLIKAGLKASSRQDLGFLRRQNGDGTFNLRRLNLEEILKGVGDEELKDNDEIIVYALSRYVDTLSFEVAGAVREPGVFLFDRSGLVTVYDAIVLAGGLKSHAEEYGYIYRKDSAGGTQLQYLRVAVKEAILNPDSKSNISILPQDRLVIGSKTEFVEPSYIEIKGAVRKPGRYDYGENMKIIDALSLAGGFTFAAATNRIDLFRVELKDNQATQTIVATVEVDRNLNVIGQENNIALLPFDQIVVREVPEFEFQQNVAIEGEIRYPGPYALTGDNEKLSSIIQRAGGLTQEAFPEGATLFRPLDSIGFVVIDLAEAMSDPKSRFNIILKDEDVITVPKKQDLVRVIGFTNAADLYPDRILSSQNGIAVPFHKGKNAKFYIDQFAAGISSEGDACSITVEHANGQVQDTKNYGLFRSYPKVRPGSIIKVGMKEKKDKKVGESGEREEVDWGKVFANSVAQATTILSLILLLQRID